MVARITRSDTSDVIQTDLKRGSITVSTPANKILVWVAVTEGDTAEDFSNNKTLAEYALEVGRRGGLRLRRI